MASLAGIDFIYDSAGSIESSLTASYAKMVLDDDMCGMAKRILAGADTSEESLATEVIESTGLKGGYLSSPHTLRHYKSEAFVGQNFWRGARTSWANYKQKDIVAKARKRAEQLINEHVMRTPLDPETDRKMMEFIKKVEKRGYPK
jgi:trimethylamine--corrinoid protein Co-methyltransferase